MTNDSRLANETSHGKFLAKGDPEKSWGWASPAGMRRAARRGRLLGEAARLSPGKRVLEIGCGTGLFSKAFAATGSSVTALELSTELCEVARERLSGLDVQVVNCAFENFQPDQQFDAVIASSVLHHLDYVSALERIHDLLKAKGRIAFAEPNMLNPQIFIERTFRFLFPQVSKDETAFRRTSIAKTLADLGYVDIEVVPFDWLHPSTPKPLINTVERLGRCLESVPVIREFSGSLIISASKLSQAPSEASKHEHN